ncbi:uncharacterized protein LOC127724904 [Mytilus californianus]|uniref:uncharacterized protein LOC127724904 n=1 Tax=Mytilus californianus TaxID=6549 RepID=UPI002245A66F|nr:uncharacterized protein LOC127724904 [Mytilus californianus]
MRPTIRKVNFDDCYIYNIYDTNKDKSYLISWDGDSVSSYSCKIGFHGYDSDNPLNEYKVCIRATTWNIQNTQVRLKYYTGLSDFLEKTYSYYAYDVPTTEWCSESGEYVDIELTAPDVKYGDKITLVVRGVRTYNFANTLGFIIGGAVGGVLLITLVCIVLVIVAFRRRSRPMAGYVNQGYPSITAPPPYYGTTKNVQTGYPAQSCQDQPSYQQYPTQSSSQQTTTTSNSQSQQSSSQEQSIQST